MKRINLTEQMVLVPGDKDAYYKTKVLLNDGSELNGTATIPDHGKVNVAKETIHYPYEHTSFAWQVVK